MTRRGRPLDAVFHLDARPALVPDPAELTDAQIAEFTKNRCLLRDEPGDDFNPPDQMIDERS
jgi:hypothetical protein